MPCLAARLASARDGRLPERAPDAGHEQPGQGGTALGRPAAAGPERAGDRTAWARLPGLHDQPDLRDAEPDTLRHRIWHLPARLARRARKRILKVSPDWPWNDAFITCRNRPCALPAPSWPAPTAPAIRQETHSGRVEAGAAPGAGQHPAPPARTNTDMNLKNQPQHEK